jgi:ribosome-binding protein aMBF1 (putative translation factor)
MLKWSIDDLSNKSGIGTTTLKRLESADGVPNAQVRTIEVIKKTLEEAGIEFIGTPESGAGVRWKV